MAETTVDAFGHVDVITRRAAAAIITRFGVDGDSLGGANRLAEFASKVPLHLKSKNRQGKYLLRKVLDRYVPRELVERPKMGFDIPIADWLRGPLRDWAESLLDERRLVNDGFFHSKQIRVRWEEHLAGKRNWQFHLWDILMFQAWLDEYR